VVQIRGHDLPRRRLGMHLGRVNLVALQHVLHQRPGGVDFQLPLKHAVIRFDNGALLGLQPGIRLNDHGNFGVLGDICLAGVLGHIVHQLGLPAKAAQYKVPVVAVLLAICTHMPAHAGKYQCVWRDQAGLIVGCGERHIIAFQSLALATGPQQWPQYLGSHGPVRYLQELSMRIGQRQALNVRRTVMTLIQQVQIGAGAVIDKAWLKALAWYIALQMLVVLKVLRGMLGDVGVDVFGGLLAADTKALDQVLCGQSTLPPSNRFDQAVAKGEIPADGFRGVAAFYGVLTCLKS